MACSFFDKTPHQNTSKRSKSHCKSLNITNLHNGLLLFRYKLITKIKQKGASPPCQCQNIRHTILQTVRRQAAKNMVTKILLQTDWKTGTMVKFAKG